MAKPACGVYLAVVLACSAVVVTAAGLVVSVDTSKITHQLNPLWMGCHSDSGFAHTERGFYSQMIYGESFEFGNQSSWHYIYPNWDPFPTAATSGGLRWNPYVAQGVTANIGYDQA